MSEFQTSRKAVLWLSIAFMGLSHMVHFKQYGKGILYALVNIVFLTSIPAIVRSITGMITLGVHNPNIPVMFRDHSMFMLIDGVIILAVIAIYACVYVLSVKGALRLHQEYASGVTPSKSWADAINNAFPAVALAPSVLLVVFFVIVPLVFAALVAFTNYSAPFHLPPANTVDWVGFANFRALFGGEVMWATALVRVAIWTFVWGLLATVTCYFGGMFLAVLMHENKMKVLRIYRAIFILPYAVPAVISMMVWRNLLNGTFGAVNRTLMHLGIIDSIIPWLTDEWLVRFTVVLINLWAGFPYFMLLTMGAMTAISRDTFAAAEIDGAGKFNLFRYITFPMVTYQTMPLIIMSFAHNINNFGAIFFLTGGQPVVADTTISGATGADILITWIYRLTAERMQYHYASVLAIMIFVVMAPFAIFNFMRTKSFREGEL